VGRGCREGVVGAFGAIAQSAEPRCTLPRCGVDLERQRHRDDGAELMSRSACGRRRPGRRGILELAGLVPCQGTEHGQTTPRSPSSIPLRAERRESQCGSQTRDKRPCLQSSHVKQTVADSPSRPQAVRQADLFGPPMRSFGGYPYRIERTWTQVSRFSVGAITVNGPGLQREAGLATRPPLSAGCPSA
jgi:hypothetical protein